MISPNGVWITPHCLKGSILCLFTCTASYFYFGCQKTHFILSTAAAPLFTLWLNAPFPCVSLLKKKKPPEKSVSLLWLGSCHRPEQARATTFPHQFQIGSVPKSNLVFNATKLPPFHNVNHIFLLLWQQSHLTSSIPSGAGCINWHVKWPLKWHAVLNAIPWHRGLTRFPLEHRENLSQSLIRLSFEKQLHSHLFSPSDSDLVRISRCVSPAHGFTLRYFQFVSTNYIHTLYHSSCPGKFSKAVAEVSRDKCGKLHDILLPFITRKTRYCIY